MHYVKQFNINGVATKQVACIELHGAPNAATEGAIGVLGMDITSPTHEVYRCVAVNGSVYTWELLSAGMSIISATITGEGGETKSFPYTSLRVPNNYLIKVGDLILDSEGYLYQISSIGSDSCHTTYCGTHIGGMASGDKDYSIVIVDGKLQLVTESGNVISNLDYLSADEDTLHRDDSTGVTSVRGIKTIGDTSLRLFVGTKAEYDALTEEQKTNLFAIISDDTTKEDIETAIKELQTFRDGVLDGTIVAEKAEVAETANDVAHLYHHVTRVTIPALDDSTYSSIGEMVFDIAVTSPSATPPSTAEFFYRAKGVARPWRGVYTVGSTEYDITSYTYNGEVSYNGYVMATITRGGGAGAINFVFWEHSAETTTVQLY